MRRVLSTAAIFGAWQSAFQVTGFALGQSIDSQPLSSNHESSQPLPAQNAGRPSRRLWSLPHARRQKVRHYPPLQSLEATYAPATHASFKARHINPLESRSEKSEGSSSESTPPGRQRRERVLQKVHYHPGTMQNAANERTRPGAEDFTDQLHTTYVVAGNGRAKYQPNGHVHHNKQSFSGIGSTDSQTSSLRRFWESNRYQALIAAIGTGIGTASVTAEFEQLEAARRQADLQQESNNMQRNASQPQPPEQPLPAKQSSSTTSSAAVPTRPTQEQSSSAVQEAADEVSRSHN